MTLARYGTDTTTSTSTSTTSASTTTTTTAPTLSFVGTLLDNVSAILAGNPLLQPSVALIDALAFSAAPERRHSPGPTP